MTNKAELVEAVSNDTRLSKADAQLAITSALNVIIKSVAKGDPVTLVGFGTFSSGKRAARSGRNPQTGESIRIAAVKTVKFSAGKSFKDTVNKRK